MSSKTTKRSLKLLRDDNYTCEVVERWNSFTRTRHDLFGFADILCLCPFRGILAVQTTVAGKMNERVKKIKAEPRAQRFLEAGGQIIVHGWIKGGKLSEHPGRWICKQIKYPQGII